jgi:hypothetical protein
MNMKAETLRKELEEKHEKERQRLEIELALIGDLPGGLKTPVVSNVRKEGPVNAWVSFSRGFGDGAQDPVKILQAFESVGWRPRPTSLCKWDNYRKVTEVGTCKEIREAPLKTSYHKLMSAQAISPVWFRAGFHRASELECFLGRNDQVVRVGIEIPGLVSVTARSEQPIGQPGVWHFVGPARTHIPAGWLGIPGVFHQGFVDDKQNISGVVYFLVEEESQDKPQALASELLQTLLDAKAEQENRPKQPSYAGG